MFYFTFCTQGITVLLMFFYLQLMTNKYSFTQTRPCCDKSSPSKWFNDGIVCWYKVNVVCGLLWIKKKLRENSTKRSIYQIYYSSFNMHSNFCSLMMLSYLIIFLFNIHKLLYHYLGHSRKIFFHCRCIHFWQLKDNMYSLRLLVRMLYPLLPPPKKKWMKVIFSNIILITSIY